MKTTLVKSGLFMIILLLLVSFFGGAPAAVEAAPKPSNTPRSTNTSRPSNTPRPTNTTRPTNPPKSTNTPRFTFTPAFTSTQTATETATNTRMPTFTATASNTATDLPTHTYTPSFTATDPPTATASPTSTGTSTATPVPVNLLAYWKFDEGSGSTVADSSGNGHTFFMTDQSFGNIGRLWTISAAPTTFSNPLALQLLPPNQRLFTADTIELANKSFSVAMWVARTPTDGHFSSDGSQMFFSHGNCDRNGCPGTDRTLLMGFRASGVFTCGFNGDDLDTSAITLDGNWHQYVCAYDAVNNVRKAYKDGVLVGSDTPLGNYVGAGQVQIGFWQSGRSVGMFAGVVDEARIYDSAISAAQVAALAERDPAYTPAPCTPHVQLMPAGGLKIPQLLQLEATVDNGCGSPPAPEFTPDPFTFIWSCQSDTSVECPNFLTSANAPPNGNWMPVLNLQEFDIIQIWVTVCLVDHPSVCSVTEHIYEGAAVN